MAVVLFIATSTAGCGWHPRGSYQLPPDLRELRTASLDSNSALLLKLNRALKSSKVEVTDAPTATRLLQLGHEEQKMRNVSLDQAARSAEREMRVTVEIRVLDKEGKPVWGPQPISASRIYSYDPNSVIAKEDEERLIYGELQDNMIGQIMRRLQRIKETDSGLSTPAP